MKVGTVVWSHAGIALFLAGYSLLFRPVSLVLVWPAVAFAVVAVAFAAGRPDWLGKDETGRRSPGMAVLLMPYLAFCLGTWQISRRLDRRPPVHGLGDDLFIGRRCGRSELPQEVRSILDLTSELREPASIRKDLDLTLGCVPLLDAMPPSDRAIDACLRTLARLPAPVFLHCAQGSGRTATIAAAWLLRTGQASDVASALQGVLEARPDARPNQTQVQALERWWSNAGQLSTFELLLSKALDPEAVARVLRNVEGANVSVAVWEPNLNDDADVAVGWSATDHPRWPMKLSVTLLRGPATDRRRPCRYAEALAQFAGVDVVCDEQSLVGREALRELSGAALFDGGWWLVSVILSERDGAVEDVTPVRRTSVLR